MFPLISPPSKLNNGFLLFALRSCQNPKGTFPSGEQNFDHLSATSLLSKAALNIHFPSLCFSARGTEHQERKVKNLFPFQKIFNLQTRATSNFYHALFSVKLQYLKNLAKQN
jgi:hypothetical protein